MRIARTLLAAIVLTSLVAQRAAATCPEARYAIKGSVVDELHKPVSGVRVLLFADDNSSALAPEAKLPLTAPDGTFTFELSYPTFARGYTGAASRDCSRRLRKLDIVVASSPTYYPLHKRIKLKRQVRQVAALDYSVILDPVVLIKRAFDP
jgi:hypothetical protein